MAANTDSVVFGPDIATDQLWFSHVGNNLEISIIGSTDKLVVKDWYASMATHTEQFMTAEGKVLIEAQVQALVDAMAGMSAPPMGQSQLSQTVAE